MAARSSFVSLVVTLLLYHTSPTNALNVEYCSSQNTGSGFSDVTNQYQSNGACFDTCNSQYAFAIIQGQSCWCSDYAPADTTSTSSCNEPCPGYPFEDCGSTLGGLFGYIALSKSPSGTQGASSSILVSSPASSAPPSTSQAVSSHFTGEIPFSTQAPSSVQFSSSSANSLQGFTSSFGSISTMHSSLTSSSSVSSILTSYVQSFSEPPSSVTVLETVTASPSVEISFIPLTPSSTPLPTTSSEPSFTSSSPESTTLTTSISAISSAAPSTPLKESTSNPPAALSTNGVPSTILTSSSDSTFSTSSSWTPTPFMSVTTVTGQLKTVTITPTAPPAPTEEVEAPATTKGGFFSSTGKVAGVFTAVGILIVAITALIIWLIHRRKTHFEAIAVPSSAGDFTPQRRPSRLSTMGLMSGGAAGDRVLPPITTTGLGPGPSHEKSADSSTPMDRRTSYPRIVDQRLEPTALWNPLHDNGSHVSLRSFRDDQDYSRRFLRVANPDDS